MYLNTLRSFQIRVSLWGASTFKSAAYIVTALLLSARQTGAAPTFILHHGRIVTVDERFSVMEAIAVTGDRVSAVGKNDEILLLKDATTELVDLKGAMILPGLMDSHSHPVGAATTEFDHPIPDIEDIASLLSYIADRTQVVPEGSLIGVSQVFITRLREQRYPHKGGAGPRCTTPPRGLQNRAGYHVKFPGTATGGDRLEFRAAGGQSRKSGAG